MSREPYCCTSDLISHFSARAPDGRVAPTVHDGHKHDVVVVQKEIQGVGEALEEKAAHRLVNNRECGRHFLEQGNRRTELSQELGAESWPLSVVPSAGFEQFGAGLGSEE